MKVSQTKNDLMGHLAEQVMFLRASSKSYDNGFEGEAKRLATVIRVLVHDTTSSKSLLCQLDVIGNMEFYDTAWDFNPKNLIAHNGLTAMRIGNGEARYVAPLDNRPFQGVWVTFTSWWNKIVFVDDEKYRFTRKKIILAVANQDGGAHIDPGLDMSYAALSRGNSMGWMFNDGIVEKALPGPELPAIRQMAHEMVNSLQKQFPGI